MTSPAELLEVEGYSTLNPLPADVTPDELVVMKAINKAVAAKRFRAILERAAKLAVPPQRLNSNLSIAAHQACAELSKMPAQLRARGAAQALAELRNDAVLLRDTYSTNVLPAFKLSFEKDIKAVADALCSAVRD